MKSFFIKHTLSLVIGGAAIISIAGAAWYISSSHEPSFSTLSATKGNVISSLDESATALAENSADLSFQEPGQIAQLYVKEGDTVSQGATLASLSQSSLQASVEEANAAVSAAQAKLDELMSGTRPEQLTIDQTAVTSAQSAVSVDIANAYAAADDAVHNQTDNLFSNPRSNNPIFLVPMSNSQDLNNIQSSRVTIEAALSGWYSALNASSSNQSSLATIAATTLSQVQSYLNTIALAANDAIPNSTMTTSILAGYKVNVSTARTEVDVAVTTLTAAQSALQTAQNNLALAQAGSTQQDIEAQQAAVAQAQAGAASAQVALQNASIVAPFSGTVQNLTAQVGEVVSPGVPILTLVNNGGLKIQVYASEADVAKIKTGDKANITLDAFGTGTTFPATVTTIDNAETQVNGSPSYLITLHFTQAEPSIKDGMTGNAHIILAEHDNVTVVPSRLVINNDGNYFVVVTTATGTQEVPVQIGLTGDNGMTEITSGINAGDQLANF